MKYNEVDWDSIEQRQRLWWEGKLDDLFIHIFTGVDPSVKLEPRPSGNEAVKRWFMDPETRMNREYQMAVNREYFLDGFPSMDIGRINLALSLMYGPPETNFTEHTIWVGHLLEDGIEGWQEKLQYNRDHELWQMTRGMAEKAVELAGEDICITQVGGTDGPLDNFSQLRGAQEALMDLIEEDWHEDILRIEEKFLQDFDTYYFELYDIIKDNPSGVCLWDRSLMVNGPAHILQSDFSCMISPQLYEKFGRFYLEHQTRKFANSIYHLDGANALYQLPLIASLEHLDCIQFIHNHSGGQKLIEVVDIVQKIQETGKTVEVFSWMATDVIEFLKALPDARNLRIITTPATPKEAEEMVKEIRAMGYCRY